MVSRKVKREKEKGVNYFFEVLKIQKHFFKDFINKLKNVIDPRHQSYITYGAETLLFTMIIKNMAGIKSMRGMTESLNKEECIWNIKKAIGLTTLEELPHYDTINDFLSKLDSEELEKIRTYMIKELLKKRALESYRIEDKYWGIIIDGTGLHTFHKKHCAHCLKREYTDKETGDVQKTIYMHHVLEAKLVIGDMVFSVGTEFIENESENVTKQDCELKAFYRLAKKIKQTFKRLPICLLGDSLYACEPVFKLCEEYNWKYLCRFKEGRIESISLEFKALKKMEQSKRRQGEQSSDLFWINDIAYNSINVNLMEVVIEMKASEECQNKVMKKERKEFVFITNLKVTKKNAERLIIAGRSRWKIENQGFNQQKNSRYDIEHISSNDYTAMKNHYLLIQITDIIRQLYENGSVICRSVKKTTKEKSSNLLEAIRTRRITDEDMIALVKPIQVRFT